MPRLQILELPEGAGDDRPPFALVIDRVSPEWVDVNAESMRDIKDKIGARCVLAFDGDDVEIPANEIPVDPNGYPVRPRGEGDFEQLHEQLKKGLR
ncbi:hypothetical protein TR631_12410 [Streptomyces rochei]|uniref:hypothetical protein n=1 Tax=Streptomyces rochei TaxID=1928 RepID=UPI002ACEF49D|nr:hypothetical protein [Streptomyces rochei]WQC12570.1 hypothetical protein TR631_12410 [Streptomyces rochei]